MCLFLLHIRYVDISLAIEVNSLNWKVLGYQVVGYWIHLGLPQVYPHRALAPVRTEFDTLIVFPLSTLIINLPLGFASYMAGKKEFLPMFIKFR